MFEFKPQGKTLKKLREQEEKAIVKLHKTEAIVKEIRLEIVKREEEARK